MGVRAAAGDDLVTDDATETDGVANFGAPP